MFSGESRVGRRRAAIESDEPALESPKTPRFILGPQNFSTTRLAIPYLNRPSMSLPSSPISPSPPTAPRLAHSPQPPLPAPPQESTSSTVRPSRTRERHQSPRREDVGVEPADAHLAQLADIGRRRRKGKSKSRDRRCELRFKHRRVRAKALTCVISGLVSIILNRETATMY